MWLYKSTGHYTIRILLLYYHTSMFKLFHFLSELHWFFRLFYLRYHGVFLPTSCYISAQKQGMLCLVILMSVGFGPVKHHIYGPIIILGQCAQCKATGTALCCWQFAAFQPFPWQQCCADQQKACHNLQKVLAEHGGSDWAKSHGTCTIGWKEQPLTYMLLCSLTKHFTDYRVINAFFCL